MRHATAADLERLRPLLAELRALPQLRERTPGSFYLRSSGFLHFHIDHDDVFADVKVPGPTFDRVRVTEPQEQDALLALIRTALEPPA